MLLPDGERDFNFASTPRKKFVKDSTKSERLQSTSQLDLLQVMIESFIDGILILTTEGKLILTNEYARCICRQLMPTSAASNAVPGEIWRVCLSLIESSELFSEDKFIIESELETSQGMKLRIRARWLQLGAGNESFLLVTVEDCNQYNQSMAIADAKKYHLTERETEVWQLRRANFSYQEIANQLYITINTVKKHLKNIHAKQQDLFWSNSFGEMQN
ncbi:helix-turn-helix transcriptional regulator [Calothrix sp. PCC 7507]|uniref:helix-turn-helix transcriptional regulator n=1 Tax=Calothrix sp. PCC 7507 TaxID=99598 RepID=UPI00029EF37B|nr:helix-turn-helix transcriptional regulator [Calothrix sp. PCC 7507]AFY33465.1 regulatory protein LuxR [Calothrix sp. PCC 7507]